MLALNIGAISQFDDRIRRLSGACVEPRFAVVRPVKGGWAERSLLFCRLSVQLQKSGLCGSCNETATMLKDEDGSAS